MFDFSKLVGFYRQDLEDRDFLSATQTDARYLSFGDLPERIDPRNHPLGQEGWLQVENQGQIGSCQGASLSENIEYCYTVATNKVLQFSKMFAYLESQRFDNIRSDSGSTLSGGTKAVKQSGICRQEIAPYPSRYPGHSWITQEMREDASKYKLLSHTEMTSVEQIKAFIGSGIGIVQIGISWNNSMTPSSNGTITSFSGGGGGGHAVVFAGYLPDSDVGARSSAGYWLLLKNSWGTRWGVRGYCYVDPRAVEQMLRHQFTVMIGRSEMTHPEPRPVPVDFTKPGQSMYA
jgi:C1A family cysteine protease